MSYSKAASVSTKLTFPCTECNFEAQSARQLSRHKAVTHTQNALKCVLCPFVTAYQTNLLRHRKDVHGICGSKGNKSCKFCGFVSEDNDTLIHHQIEVHQDILKSAQVKFAKELVSAGGDESIADFSANFESMSEELFNGRGSFQLNLSNKKQPRDKKPKVKNFQQATVNANNMSSVNNVNNNRTATNNGCVPEANNEFDDFWKAGFMDNYGEQAIYFGQGSMMNLDMQPDSVPTSRSSTPKSQSSHNNKDLPATRIRRQYSCNECGFRTVNPREFLYHRRDGHGHRIKIVECPYCVYACQYVQKLQRHLLLVHKLQTLVTPTGESVATGDGEDMLVKSKFKKFKHDFDGSSLLDNDISNSNMDQDILPEEDNQSLNDEDFEHMNNFEMNLNEFENDCQKDDDDGEKDEEDEEEYDNIPVSLECFICKIKFADIASAQKHYMKNHKYNIDSKSYMNNMKIDSSPAPVTTSQRKVFDSVKNVHSCNYCGYKTRWISELERHVRVHSKEKPFKCMFCDFKSKWKGDLNRHIQRYHSSEHTSVDLESDASANYVGGSSHADDMSPSASLKDEKMHNPKSQSFAPDNSADDFNSAYECSLEIDVSDGAANGEMSNTVAAGNVDGENEESLQSPNSNTAKMYKCTYCDFMCSTASRFHVHYVQHLNTKPFQCSICGHRSNWEWDVTKHIKMKAQRDPNHAKARPVLIHDSGKRDYSKYNKFVVWVGQAEADMANKEANKIDFRAKRFRAEVEIEEPEGDDILPIGNLLMPEVCFQVDDDNNTFENNSSTVAPALKSGTMPSNTRTVVTKSVIVSRHANSRNRIIYCNDCDFSHQFARVIVAHMASHFGSKSYACNCCSFQSNWREVIVSHIATEHKDTDRANFDMRFRCVIDEFCVCRIISAEEGSKLEAETLAANELWEPQKVTNETNSSLIEPNIYEEKAVIRCELCPFLTTNLKKMSIHCRFHSPSKGSLKCQYCPYYVKLHNKDKLLRHQKLHQKIGSSASYSNIGGNANETHDSFMYSQSTFSAPSKMISCALCSFQSINRQMLSEHMKIHDSANFDYETSENYHDQMMHEEKFYPTELDDIENDDDDTGPIAQYGNNPSDNSMSIIDINNMKNGTAKKFSYVCPDCPAAFKSPGDYKIHAVFHTSNYQHACPYCSYKARNKPQLCKHLYVHTAEYIAKRANSYPDGTKHLVGNQDGFNPSLEGSSSHHNQIFSYKQKLAKAGRKHRTKIEFPMKPVKVKLNSEENGKQKIVFNNTDLMASQEFLETKEYLQRINSGIKNRCMYRCSTCPAVFTKVNTLIYHMTLHDQKAQFTCDSCTYSTATEDNCSIHSLLHNLTESQAALGYNFNYNCHKCPAGFSKRTRLEKHLSLHGAKFNWKCDKCDYSVRYAATLVKHRALHLINPNFRVLENNLSLGNLEDLGELSEKEEETNLVHPNLKLKLSMVQQQQNGILSEEVDADCDGDVDEEQQLLVDSSEMVVEENSQENSEEEEIPVHEIDENESFSDSAPEVMLYEDEVEEVGNINDNDDSLPELTIETNQ